MSTSTAVSFKQYGGNAAENYERYFVPTIGVPFATALLDAAELRWGEHVLDVACGTGVVTRLAAERVAPDGAVAGLDINAAMLAVARSVPSSGAEIEWYEATAESLPLADGSFDVVLISLGLQFVADKASALREMRRVLAPMGAWPSQRSDRHRRSSRSSSRRSRVTSSPTWPPSCELCSRCTNRGSSRS